MELNAKTPVLLTRPRSTLLRGTLRNAPKQLLLLLGRGRTNATRLALGGVCLLLAAIDILMHDLATIRARTIEMQSAFVPSHMALHLTNFETFLPSVLALAAARGLAFLLALTDLRVDVRLATDITISPANKQPQTQRSTATRRL